MANSLYARPSRRELAVAHKANKLVAAMRAGAVLHLHFERGHPRWHLSNGTNVEPEVARAALDCPEIEPGTDALPIDDVFPQSFVIKGSAA